MRRVTLVAAATCVLGTTVPAQEPVQPVDATAKQFLPNPVRDAALAAAHAGYQGFLDREGERWESRWNYATGTPKAIWGPGLQVSERAVETEAEARGLAERVLRDQRAVLDPGASTLTEATAVKVNHTWVFVYEQWFRGVPVLGGRADIRLVDNGVVSMLGSQLLPIPADFGMVPGVGETLARARALLHLDLAGFVESDAQNGARLVIWADLHATERQLPVLCWEVTVSGRDGNGAAVARRVYVDARTGAIAHEIDDVYECGFEHAAGDPDAAETRMGLAAQLRSPRPAAAGSVGGGEGARGIYSGNVLAWLNDGNAGNSPIRNVPLRNLQVSAGGAIGYTDGNGDFAINSSLNTPQTVTLSLRGRHLAAVTSASGGVPTASAVVTPGTPAQFQFLTSSASRSQTAATTVYWAVDQVNEYVRGLFTAVPAQMNGLDSMRADVNLSQTCNAFYTQNTINFYSAGGGCNNTAFGDVIAHEWGHGLDDAFGGISNNNSDGMSEAWGDIIGTYWTGQPILGRFFTTSGGFVRTALNTRTYGSCTSGPHCAGESFMGFAWQVRTRFQNSLGTAAGIAHAERIVIGSMVADATNQPDAVREIFILDDNDGNLINGTPNYLDLEWAAQQRNIPYPVRRLSDVTHTPLPTTDEALTGRVVRANVQAVTGSVTTVQVRTTIGGTTTVRDMLATGSGTEHIAVIPGAPSPASVQYQIEVGNSAATGVEVFGPWSYKVGVEETLFFDDFESGTNGWTHQLLANQDDWQLGAPQGKSGDPSSAYSGNSCWGNDLGPTGWNGAYQNRTQNLLRSPTFSTLGKTGVTLQYWRWLTVEEGIYDNARIEANGAIAWQNQANGNTIDTAWTFHEVPMPGLDNRSSAQIIWRLITDAGLTFGGWNLDDVKVIAFNASPPLPVTMQILPEQAALGAPMTLQAQGQPNAPGLLVLGDNPGPTMVPGLPTFSIGAASPQTVPLYFDGSGAINLAFNAPAAAAAAGSMWYAQMLSLDASNQIVLSNVTINLFQ